MSTLLALHDTVTHLMVVASANVPDPGNGTAPPGSEKFTDVLGWLKWVALGVAVAGVIILGAKLTIDNNRGEGGRHLGSLGYIMVGIILISAAVSVVSFAAS